jgi:hypothetical protein
MRSAKCSASMSDRWGTSFVLAMSTEPSCQLNAHLPCDEVQNSFRHRLKLGGPLNEIVRWVLFSRHLSSLRPGQFRITGPRHWLIEPGALVRHSERDGPPSLTYATWILRAFRLSVRAVFNNGTECDGARPASTRLG